MSKYFYWSKQSQRNKRFYFYCRLFIVNFKFNKNNIERNFDLNTPKITIWL